MAEQTSESVTEYFPGLNKKHGFYRVIERNQESRDEYHKAHELWKEEKRKEQDAEILSKRHSAARRKNRDDKRPDRQMYVPPGSGAARRQDMKKAPLYRLEIEVLPDVMWRKDIFQFGQEKQLSRRAAMDYHLDRDQETVLKEIINEFESKLKLNTTS